MMKSKIRVWSSAVLYGSGIIVALLVAEIICRLMGLGYGNAPLEPDLVVDHKHPTNYSFIAHTPSGEFGGFKIRYDNEGLVINPNDSVKKNDLKCEYRIALMGDSCVEVGQVAYENSFFGRMEMSAKPGVCIKNYGVSSYSPVLYNLLWDKMVHDYSPTHVFLLLYSNDLRDDEMYHKRAVFSPKGTLIGVPGRGGLWKIPLRRSYLVRFVRMIQLKIGWIISHRSEVKLAGKDNVENVEEDYSMTSLTEKHLLEISRKVKESGAEFILMALPSKNRLQNNVVTTELSFSEITRIWAKDHQIRWIDLDEPFKVAAMTSKVFFDIDIHPNEVGNKAIYEAIKKEYGELFTQN